MCMMGDPGSRNLVHPIPETAFNGADDDDEEEGGDRWSVAFPRMTDEEEVIDAP